MDSLKSDQELSSENMSQQQSVLSLPSLELQCHQQDGHQHQQDFAGATKEKPTAYAATGSAVGASSTLPISAFTRSKYRLHRGSVVTDAVKYRECLKNHEASVGGRAVDGCEEFTPSGIDDAGLCCGACGCLRSDHRLEVVMDVMPICMLDPTSGITVYFMKQGV